MNLKVIAAVCLAASSMALAQAPSTVTTQTGRYLYQMALPVPAAAMRSALPGIFDESGHERRVMSGTVTVNGVVTPFVFTRELDQKVRLDLGTPVRTQLVNGLNSTAGPQLKSAGSESQTGDAEILEAFADDSEEAFLFGYGTVAQIRPVGQRYRTDDGKSPSYAGPYYDIYVRTASAVDGSSLQQTKTFLVDGETNLLGITRYRVERGGTNVNVEVAFSGWTNISGQMVPTKISRLEDGKQIFTVSITAASSGATQPDSLFSF